MPLMPDPTFYPSPGMAMKAAPEHIAYVADLNVGNGGTRDATGVIDVDPNSPAYGQLVGQVDFPDGDNELHHFGLERVQCVPLPPESAPAYGTSLPDRSIRLNSHPGYESES